LTVHPQTQGKIERWHQTLNNRILLENYHLPGATSNVIPAHLSSTISIDNIYFGRAETIVTERAVRKIAQASTAQSF
jgi:hypothetical protein